VVNKVICHNFNPIFAFFIFYFSSTQHFAPLGAYIIRLHKVAGSWWPLPYQDNGVQSVAEYGPGTKYLCPPFSVRTKLMDFEFPTENNGI